MPLVDSKMIKFTLTETDIKVIKAISDCGCMTIEELVGIAPNESVMKLSMLGFIRCDEEKCCISEMVKRSLAETLRKKRKKIK